MNTELSRRKYRELYVNGFACLCFVGTLCREIVKVYVEKISNCQKSNFLSAGLKPPFAGF